LISERFDEFLKDSVSRLSSKLAEVETAMHAGMGDISSRMMTNEVLYRKMFTEAEDRLRKGIEPEIKAIDCSFKTLRDKVVWLTDEYDIVMKRKIRALEGRYAAYDAIITRMDTLTEQLKDPDAVPRGRA
jgi:hypothetical protein